jgi:diacylglycerol kinase family enzyme
MWVGVGFDARMIRGAHSGLKRVLGRAGIGVAGVNAFMRYDFPGLVVEGVDERGAAFTREGTYVVAANIQRYGGEMKIAPLADPADDLIDIVLFTGRTHAELARFLFDIGTGAMERGPVANVTIIRARSAAIRTKSGRPEQVLVDGDGAGETPIEIGPIAGQVNILVPE